MAKIFVELQSSVLHEDSMSGDDVVNVCCGMLVGVGGCRRAGTRADLDRHWHCSLPQLLFQSCHNNFLPLNHPPQPPPLRSRPHLSLVVNLGLVYTNSRTWYLEIEPAHHPCGATRRLCLKLSSLSALLPAQCPLFLLLL
jgi:hypothetical protein